MRARTPVFSKNVVFLKTNFKFKLESVELGTQRDSGLSVLELSGDVSVSTH